MFHVTHLARLRRWAYPVLVTIIVIAWFVYLTVNQRWELYLEYWPVSLTMLFGSFIGSSTPQGGAAVSFPVFTKLLQISAADSRTFGFMIQSIGMTMASVLILARGIKILPKVVLWVTLGGVLGTVLGTYVLIMPSPFPRILFTLGATAFGVALFISRWVLKWEPRQALPGWSPGDLLVFIVVGILGGIFTAQTGSGANMIAFIVLTLAFGIDEKVGTPTSVIIMALNSWVGFFLHGVISQDIGIVWDYWIVAVPVVAFGAPLGAFVVSHVSRDVLISFVLFLITVEMITTLLLIPFSNSMITITAYVLGGCALSFFAMLYYRQKRLALLPAGTD
jgi:uncharacterized membrane protein YfcA